MRPNLLLIFLLFACSAAFSQELCKSKVKANRELVLMPGKLVPESRTWKEENTKTVVVYYKQDHDSLVVTADGRTTVLLAKDKTIISETFSEYYPDGKLSHTDTLTGTQKRPGYIGSYAARVKSKYKYNEDGSPSYMIAYDAAGKISLHRKWHENGRLAAFHDWEKEVQYYEDGSIATLTNKLTNEDREFFKTGKLSFRSKDTIVNSVPLVYEIRYYENGKKKKEEWYLRDRSKYGTWSYYDESGKLINQQKHTTIYHPNEEYGPRAIQSIDLTSHATFIKSEKDFRLFMADKLTTVVCESRGALEGMYHLTFRITESGKPEFIAIEGKNASYLNDLMKELFVSMPEWQPGYEGFTKVNEVFRLELKVD